MTSVQALLLHRHSVSQTPARIHSTSAQVEDAVLPLASDNGQWALYAHVLPLAQHNPTLMPLALPPGLEPPPAHYFAAPCVLVQWANRAKEKVKASTTLHGYKRAIMTNISLSPHTPGPAQPPPATPVPQHLSSDEEYDSEPDSDEDSEQASDVSDDE